MKLAFEVHSAPKGKARPRVVRNNGRVHTFTPKETRSLEDLIRFEARQVMSMNGLEIFARDEPLRATIYAFFALPKSETKKRKEQMLRGCLLPTKKPDCDNVAKLVLDALNGVVYYDDAQVTSLSIQKGFAETPRIVVFIESEAIPHAGINIYNSAQKCIGLQHDSL